jgi:hypothetical protein
MTVLNLYPRVPDKACAPIYSSYTLQQGRARQAQQPSSSKHGEPGFSPIHQRMTISYLSTGNPHTPGKVRPYPLNDMILELALIDSQQ